MTAKFYFPAVLLAACAVLHATAVHAALVHYYDFDTDTTADTVIHDTGDGPTLNGTRVSAATITPSGGGHSGATGDKALSLPGEDDYVDLGSYDFGNDFTLSAWINPIDSPRKLKVVVANKNGGNADGFAFHVNRWNNDNGEIRFENADSGGNRADGYTMGGVVSDHLGLWQHVAVVVDRTNSIAKFYYNGNEVTGAGVSNTIQNDFKTSGSWRIGEMTSNCCNNRGFMDEVAVFDQQLEDWQIRSVYQFGAPNFNVVPEPVTLLIWSLLAALGIGCGRRRRK